jgi:hypothetical protein
MKEVIKKVSKIEIIQRIFSDKPNFWKKVQIFGGIIGTVGLLITTLPIGLPVSITVWGAYMITAGASIAGVAQLPIKDKNAPEIKETIKEGLIDAKDSLSKSIKKL